HPAGHRGRWVHRPDLLPAVVEMIPGVAEVAAIADDIGIGDLAVARGRVVGMQVTAAGAARVVVPDEAAEAGAPLAGAAVIAVAVVAAIDALGALVAAEGTLTAVG